MARPHRLAALPDHLREQLHRRLVDSDFGNLVETAAWLSQQGFRVGKTTVGDYALQHRQAILDAARLERTAAARNSRYRVETRLRCAEAAARVCAGRPEALTATAAAILSWVLFEPSSARADAPARSPTPTARSPKPTA